MMATADLTAARLRELLNYDELTGNFTWRHPGKKRRLDRPAGCVKALGYIVIRVDGVLLRAHRLAWLYVHGKWPALEIATLTATRATTFWRTYAKPTRA